MRIVLRRAGLADARLLWRWANDPVRRRWSFRRERISWPTHVEWFASRLASPDRCRIYVATTGCPVGQIRFELRGRGLAEVDISVKRERRGEGIGARLIRAGCRRAARDLRLRRVVARVIRGNDASAAAFLKAGFHRNGSAVRRGRALQVFWWAPEARA